MCGSINFAMMNFTDDVIEKSNTIPIVVDFWAPWCGPCKFLGPVLEELANESDGKWELVKVNTDEHQELSAEYGIRGIPAVKMFDDGKVIAEFTGALPKHQVERWLNENLPNESQKELESILASFESDRVTGLKALKNFVKENPDFPEARTFLAQRIVFTNINEAVELVSDIKPGNKYYHIAESINSLDALLRDTENCGGSSNNTSLKEKLIMAKSGLQNNNLDEAMEALIDTVIIDKSYCDELPRKSTIAIFNLLGPDHDLTKKYRKKFDMALY